MLAEVLADGINIPEELSRKRFIDYGHVRRSCRILFRDAASFEDWISDDVEVACGDSIPKGVVVVIGPGGRLPIHVDKSTPIVAGHRRVNAERYSRDARNVGQRIVDASVEGRELLSFVAGQP